MKKHGVIFDLDGTLWDVAEITAFSANEVAKKYSLPEVSLEAVRLSMGKPREGSAELFFPDLPLEKSLPIIDEIISANIDNLFIMGGNLYPGLKKTLNVLSLDYDLFIVSNTPNLKYVESFLATSNTGYCFKNYYSAGELNLTKAQVIKKIIAENQFIRAVYVGDTDIDYTASVEAGVEFIYAKYGFGRVQEAGYIISALSELPETLKKVFL